MKAQITATESIAHNIAETERAAADVADRIQSVAIETQTTGLRADEADGICTTVAVQVRELQSDLISILRSSSEHVNRRVDERMLDRQKVDVLTGSKKAISETIDISASGIKVAGSLGKSGQVVSLALSRPQVSRQATVLESNERFTLLKFHTPVEEFN